MAGERSDWLNGLVEVGLLSAQANDLEVSLLMEMASVFACCGLGYKHPRIRAVAEGPPTGSPRPQKAKSKKANPKIDLSA